MKSYELVAEDIFRRRDEYFEKQKKIKRAVLGAVTPVVCCCVVLIAGIGVWKTAAPSKPSDNTDESGIVDTTNDNNGETDHPDNNGEIVIDTWDKLNYYAVKKVIADGDGTATMSLSALSSRNVRQMSSSSSVDIDQNSTFTVTMCSYFTAEISNVRGFLAQKLGGTGQLEVVITCNNFNNMITFKKGENYYSCLQTQMTENTMTFSTYKYVDGFSVVENHDQENYSFTVLFDGDNIVGISAGRIESNVESMRCVVDNLKMTNSLCIVSRQKQSFTVAQLEAAFKKEEIAFVNDGIVMKDGSVMFGKSSLSSKRTIAFVRNGKAIIENEDIKSVRAMYSDKIGYYVSLEMTNSMAFKGMGYAVLYIDGVQHREVTLKGDGKVVNIINLVNKANVSSVFCDLTVNETSNKIGKILDYDDFLREMPKRVDLDNYSVDVFSDNNSAYYRKTAIDLDLGSNSYQMTVDGITFSLPIKLSDFIDLGFSMQANRIDAALFEGTADFITPAGNEIQVNVANLYNDAKTIKDAYVRFVYFRCYDNWDNAQHGIAPEGVNFEFFGNVNKYSTLDQILADFGEPNMISFFFDDISKMIMLKYELYGPSTPSGYVTFMLYTPLHSGTVTSFLESVSVGLDK